MKPHPVIASTNAKPIVLLNTNVPVFNRLPIQAGHIRPVAIVVLSAPPITTTGTICPIGNPIEIDAFGLSDLIRLIGGMSLNTYGLGNVGVNYKPATGVVLVVRKPLQLFVFHLG